MVAAAGDDDAAAAVDAGDEDIGLEGQLVEGETQVPGSGRDQEFQGLSLVVHDAVQGDDRHAEESAAICRDYLERRPYDPAQIDFICYLILEHPNKRLLHEKTTPLELVVLMEADMLDDTGAMGIILDSWIASKEDDPSFESVCRHFEKYTYRHMKQMEFVTAPGKQFWHEKRNLVYEFLRQYKRDLGDMK